MRRLTIFPLYKRRHKNHIGGTGNSGHPRVLGGWVGPAYGVLANRSSPADGSIADCPVSGGRWAGSLRYRTLRAQGTWRDVATAQRAAAGAGVTFCAPAGRSSADAARAD